MKKKKNFTVKKTIYLSESLNKKLEELAEKEGKSESCFIRELLVQKLKTIALRKY